jgi:prepilin-type N-terminal cleavage/methylation domain-containing protein/prepilin-type processing-associated H-X9-DG protein
MSNRLRTRHAFTLVELLVVIAVIGLLIALLLPAVQSARESARRAACSNNLKQIGLAQLTHETAKKAFPSGFASVSSQIDRDVWNEAQNGTAGHSWVVGILPFIEQQTLYDRWDFSKNVSGNRLVAQSDITNLYCPSRRSGVREEDSRIMFMNWQSGGTDYGGCAGNSNYFYDVLPSHTFECEGDRDNERGVFGRNNPRAPKHISDGLSKTLILGEVQRMYQHPDAMSVGAGTSHDGWAVGGAATLFDTDCDASSLIDTNKGGINFPHFENPGSAHPQGANFCFADGSVVFLINDVDVQVMESVGSMAGGEVSSSIR